MRRLILAAPLLFSFSLLSPALSACGGNGTGDGGNGVDGGIDAPVDPGNDCRAGAMSSTDNYQPLQIGDVWTYEVTEVGTGNPPYTKRTEITEQMTPPGETEPVLVQVTTKSTGQTVSWFRRTGDAVIRLRQEDYDPAGLLERTTVYEPYRLRFDENPSMLVAGMTFDETYTDIVYDPQGVELQRTVATDRWLVVSADEPCSTGWGAQLSCVHVHRERVVGGIAVKDFYFARGYGKVREDGGQLEVLNDCALH